MEITSVFSQEEITTELQHVLNFSLFKKSPILSKFLEFIVLETLHKREAYLKEYTIAVNVLNRNDSFNSQDDAAVRIHAGRLRRTLQEYYLTEGIDNEIMISVPKGAYVPEFIKNKKTTENPVASDQNLELVPVVAVFPFKSYGQNNDVDLFAIQLKDEFTAELSRFRDISVIAHFSPKTKDLINTNILQAGESIEADYIITGNIQYSEKKLRVRINLLITLTGEVMMTKSIEKEILSDIFEIQDEIIDIVAGTIGGYYGDLYQQMPKAAPHKVAQNKKVWEGIHNFYKYQRFYSVQRQKTAFISLTEAVKSNPTHALSWALLGEVYLNGADFSALEQMENNLVDGFRCATESIRLNPLCQQGWQTMAYVHLLKKDQKSCYETAMHCLNLNPNCSVIVSGMGFLLICIGYLDEGYKIIEDATKASPYHPWWINCGIAAHYLAKKDYVKANYWALKVESGESFWEPLFKAVTFAYLDQNKETQEELIKLAKIESAAPLKIEAMISIFLLAEDLIQSIMTGLNKAIEMSNESGEKITLQISK